MAKRDLAIAAMHGLTLQAPGELSDDADTPLSGDATGRVAAATPADVSAGSRRPPPPPP